MYALNFDQLILKFTYTSIPTCPDNEQTDINVIYLHDHNL